MNPIVSQVIQWSNVFIDCANRALNVVSGRLADAPDDEARKLDYKQAVANHAAVLSACSDMLGAAMQVLAADATKTLAQIDSGTKRLSDVLDKIATLQHAVDVMADLVTTTSDIVTAVTTLNPGKIASAAGDLKTLVEDTIKLV